jgi:predicted RNA-binding protein Jag
VTTAGPRRDERPPRRDDRGPRRDERPPRRSGDRPGASPVSPVSSSEADEVQTARSLVREREELQAAEASPAALDAGKRLLEQLMEHMGFSVAVNIETGETNRLNVVGADDDEHEALGALIGRKGERLSALQHIVNLMLSREMGEWTRVLVDVEGYRGRREQQLREIADRAAARVVETGKMLQLEPMPALERRWIHLALRNHPRRGHPVDRRGAEPPGGRRPEVGRRILTACVPTPGAGGAPGVARRERARASFRRQPVRFGPRPVRIEHARCPPHPAACQSPDSSSR